MRVHKDNIESVNGSIEIININPLYEYTKKCTMD